MQHQVVCADAEVIGVAELVLFQGPLEEGYVGAGRLCAYDFPVNDDGEIENAQASGLVDQGFLSVYVSIARDDGPSLHEVDI